MKMLRKNTSTGLAEEITGAGIHIPKDEKPDFTTGWVTSAGALHTVITHNLNTPFENLEFKIYGRSAAGMVGTTVENNTYWINQNFFLGLDRNRVKLYVGKLVMKAGENAIENITAYKVDIYIRKERIKVIDRQIIMPGSNLVQSGAFMLASPITIAGGSGAQSEDIPFSAPFDAVPNVYLMTSNDSVRNIIVTVRATTENMFRLNFYNPNASPVTVLGGVQLLRWTAISPQEAKFVTPARPESVVSVRGGTQAMPVHTTNYSRCVPSGAVINGDAGMYDAGHFRAPVNGVYSISITAGLSANAGAGERHLFLTKNATEWDNNKVHACNTLSGANRGFPTLSSRVTLYAGDTLEFYYWNATAASLAYREILFELVSPLW